MRIIHRLALAFIIIVALRTTCCSTVTNVVGAIEGVWKTEDISVAGERANGPPKAIAFITFTNSEMIIDDGGNVHRFGYTTDATKNPCEMDQTIRHEGKIFTTKCIYRRDGDTLTIASSINPGDPRPTSFSSSPGQTPELSVMSLRLLSDAELRKLPAMGEGDTGKAAMVALRKIGARFDMNTNRLVRTVMLSGTSVSDSDLKLLASFKALDSVSLVKTPVGNDGMKHLAAIDNLRRLNLSMTAVDDAGVQALAGLKHLEVLDLIGTGITDNSVNTLSKLTRLKDVDLSMTKVTPQGKERLSRALPACDVR